MNPTDHPAPHRDGLRQGLVLLFAAAQWAATGLAFVLPFGTDIATSAERNVSPAMPAAYAFTIWAVIYPACLAHAIWQALPRNRALPWLRRSGMWAAAAFAANMSWALAAQFAPFWTTFPIIVAMLICAWRALHAVNRDRALLSPGQVLLGLVPLAMFAGWISIATFANAASLHRDLGLGIPAVASSSALVGLAGIAGAVLTRRTGGLIWFAGPILWGLVAIVARNLTDPGLVPVIVAAAVAIVLVVTALLPNGRPNQVTHRQAAAIRPPYDSRSAES